MINNKNKGFTLIELLVVIAIIGILSATVLASLSSARNKAKDAKVQGELSSMRAAAETFYSAGSTYGPTAGTSCTTGSLFLDTTSNMKGLLDAVTTDIGTGGVMSCASSTTAWVVGARLPSSSTSPYNHFCVDSTGKAATASNAAITGVVDATNYKCL